MKVVGDGRGVYTEWATRMLKRAWEIYEGDRRRTEGPKLRWEDSLVDIRVGPNSHEWATFAEE